MKSILSFCVLIASITAQGQTWYNLSCNQLPINYGCYSGGIAANINPVSDPHLFAVNDSDSTSSWVYGVSNKPFLQGTPTEGWVTDSTNSYLPNQHSELVVMHPNWEYGVTWISFEHRYQTDTNQDGGYLQFSCDSINWTNLGSNIFNSVPQQILSINHPNATIHDSISAFTGLSTEWINTSISFIWYIPVLQGGQGRMDNGCGDFLSLDTVYFKFVFDSDSIDTEKDGWMIRNITIGTHDMIGSITENGYHPLSIFPNPAVDRIEIQLPEMVKTPLRTMLYDMLGRKVYDGKFHHRQDFSFLDPGTYSVIVETEEGNFRGIVQKYE